VQLVPLSQMTVRKNRLLFAAVAVVGASVVAVNPMAPSTISPDVQHRAVKLMSGEVDWAGLVANTQDSLAALQSAAAEANTELSTAWTGLSTEFSHQIGGAFTGFGQGIDNSLFGGWYGSDDGYVFGLFGGMPVESGPTPGVEGSTLMEIAHSTSALQAFSYFDTWSLETLDHTLKPLLSPLLDETSKGATTLSIPVELSQIQTNLLEEFGNYNELKALGDSLLSPELSVAFAFSNDVGLIATDYSTGDYTQGFTDISNLPSDLTNALLNGWTDPYAGTGEAFTGLLNSGSLLESLLVTWPEQLAAALGESATTEAAEAVTATLPDLFGGLL
jgi:hypothetical protein